MPNISLGNVPNDRHPSIGAIVDFWVAIHPEDGLPGRQHFDPISIPKLLPNVGLMDVVGRPPRFRFRVAGTALSAARGMEYTGKWYDEIFENFDQTDQCKDLCHVVEQREPHWRRGQFRVPLEKDYQALERVHLPMARDGKSVDMILTLMIFFGPNDPARPHCQGDWRILTNGDE